MHLDLRNMRIFTFLIGLFFLKNITCQCTFPSSMIGSWITSNDGSWAINSTHLSNLLTVSSTTGGPISAGVTQLNFECHENQGDTKYVLRSEGIELFGELRRVHTCIDIREITNNKLVYYHATEADPSGFQFTIMTDYADICNMANYEQAYNYHVALRSGTETSALQDCPSNIYGSYNYDTCEFPGSDTSLDLCDTRQQLLFNYTKCNTTQLFSLDGTLDCIYHIDSGSVTYLTVYNRDSIAPDNNDYYRYTCLAVEESGGNVFVTAMPNRCNDNQNATSISSPGQALTLTPYFLCPITTTTLPTTTSKPSDSSSFDLVPIIIGVLAGILLLVIIILIIYCCCKKLKCCKKKKRDEEEGKSDSEDEEEEQKKKSDSRRTSKTSLDEDEEKKSIDSGISEPPVTGRTSNTDTTDGDLKDGEKELIINADGDKEIEDKTSRPCSGKLSRMSDLPPSTIPPDEDQPVSHRSEEDQIDEENDIEKDEVKEPEEDKLSEKATESDHEPEEQTEENDDKEEEKSEVSEDEQHEDEETVKDSEEEKDEEEQEKEPEDNDEPDNKKEESEEEHHSDLDNTVVSKGGETEPEKTEENDTKPETDPEEEKTKKKDKNESSDEDERERTRIGGRKGKDYTAKGALTTVLVSREEEERNRQKLANKTKAQKMRKMAKKKTRRFIGGKGNKRDRSKGDDDYGSSDDEMRHRGLREAPFMKQYEDKKHIEHILDEQHYWSEPEADKDIYKLNDDSSSVFKSDSSSESEEEILETDANGVPIRTRRRKKRDKRKKQSDGDDISNADSEYLRQKMLKRAGSIDSMVSVEDTDNIDRRKSKRRYNEHAMKTDSDEDMSERKDKKKTDENQDDDVKADNANEKMDESGNNAKGDVSANTKHSSKKAKKIMVKEHSDLTENSANNDDKETRKHRRAYNGKEADGTSDFCDSDMDKFSDRDSGMDDEDEKIDVVLTADQQQLIVGMLFDEDMNLRPQFSRDSDGRIVRKLDNTVVYDPHTGRFTYRKKLGQIFKVPRLKRNNKGRPEGGYIEDEYGPKVDPASLRRKASSARRSQGSRSGRFSADTRSSSADLKRTRNDGKNVEFAVPDDGTDNLTEDQLDYHKRGRIGSAIRRQLNKRLFRKKRKRHGDGSHRILPEVKVMKAWTDDHQHSGHGRGTHIGQGGVGQLPAQGGRYSSNSPWAQRKAPGPVDADQMQAYREGLQSDRRILENLQGKLNTGGEAPFSPKEAFVEHEGGDHCHTEESEDPHVVYDRGHSYMTDDGRIGIRERGCPELKQKKVPFFTILRRPGDFESQENLHDAHGRERNTKSAPLHVQDCHDEHIMNGHGGGTMMSSEETLVARSHDGRCSQLTSIDDNRLRRLLEELYKDKKYFDKYIETEAPVSHEYTHSQGLAEHGRGYLLKRADYWERRGPLPPKPPMTAIGWKMQRQQTLFNSRQTSELGLSTATCTPDLSVSNMPGAIQSPRQIPEENESNISPNDSYA